MNEKNRDRNLPVRKVIREVVSIAFWVHALYLTGLVPVGMLHIIPLSRATYNAALLAFIIYCSLFTKRGWWSVAFDVCYLYFWPFLISARLIWIATKTIYRFTKGKLIIEPPRLISSKEEKAVPAAAHTVAEEQTEKNLKEVSVLYYILRPIRFALLWAIYTLSITNRPLLIFAVCLSLLGAARALYQLWDFLSDTSDLISKFRYGFSLALGQHISRIKGWTNEDISESIKTSANTLKVFETAFQFIVRNKQIMSRWTTFVATLLTIPFYFYISFLFSCVYFGIAKLAGIAWPWPSALIDSLYIPFAFSNLPNNVIIQLIAGLQAIAVTMMGWNIFFRHLGNKFEEISSVASEFQLQIDDSHLKTKLILIDTSLKVATDKPNGDPPAP